MSRPLILSLLLMVLSSCRTPNRAPECPRVLRAIFDVGSGTTKLNLSEVRVCPNRVQLVRVIDDSVTRSVSLEAAKNKDGVISASGLDELRDVVREMRDHAFQVVRRAAPEFATVDFAAAGTHAYRTARNQADVVRTLGQLGVPIVTLSQGEEANLAYDGAAARVDSCGGREKITWDIGGGSMQFTRADGTFRGLAIGAEGFKSNVITRFRLSGKPSCDAKIESANPVGADNVEAALQLAADKVRANGDPRWVALDRACVIGAGGLHARSVLERVHRNWPVIQSCVCADRRCQPTPGVYRRREVECLAKLLATKGDCDVEIRGPYSGMGATNPILIAGSMRALGIAEVHVADVNMGQALALTEGRLKFQRLPVPPANMPK